MKLENLLFGDYSKRQLKKIKSAADSVDALGEKFKAMSEDELRSVTPAFRKRLENGESLESLLPEAFAAVREAADRVLGQRPFGVRKRARVKRLWLQCPHISTRLRGKAFI